MWATRSASEVLRRENKSWKDFKHAFWKGGGDIEKPLKANNTLLSSGYNKKRLSGKGDGDGEVEGKTRSHMMLLHQVSVTEDDSESELIMNSFLRYCGMFGRYGNTPE